jgi:hypothetical protein
MAASANRSAYHTNDPDRREPLGADNVHIFKGVMCCIDAAGFCVPADDNATYSSVFLVADEEFDSTGTGFSSGEVDRVEGTKEVVCSMKAVGADQSWVGEMMYVVDDDTVAPAADVTNYVLAGRCTDILSATEVLVDFSDQNCCDDDVDGYLRGV